jgi:thiol-disulfide isomerase/thioredoxin
MKYSDRFRNTFIPSDATHIINYEYHKLAAAPHNKKVLVWRCGEWCKSEKDELSAGNQLDRRHLQIKNDLERIKRILGKQSLEKIAENYNISAYKLKQILEVNKIKIPVREYKKNSSLTIFG